MKSTRRGFLSALTGMVAIPPWRLGWSELPPRVAHDTSPSTATVPGNPASDPGHPVGSDTLWLESWLRMPRLPMMREQLPQLGPDRQIEWFLASLSLSRISSGESIDFFYQGGSEPGAFRQVLPMFLFTVPTDPANPDYARQPVYLLAHCLTRKAARTFRLDRISL